jgi:hypothetical protein
MEFRSDVRPSPIAGTWYAGNAAMLTRRWKLFLGL